MADAAKEKKERTFKVGQTVIVFRRRHPKPVEGKILTFTDDPTKQVGIFFEKPNVKGCGHHSCDGRCEEGHGRWVRAYEIFTEEEFKANLGRLVGRVDHTKDFKSLTMSTTGLVMK